MSREVVLALDVASTVGWALFHGRRCYASGFFKLKCRTRNKVKEPRAAKYVQLDDALAQSYEGEGPITFLHLPTVVVTERFGGGFKTAPATELTHGLQARVEAWAYLRGLPLYRVLNWTVKKHATGNRHADKDEMVAAAKALWPKSKFSDHNEADARHIGRAYLDGEADACPL